MEVDSKHGRYEEDGWIQWPDNREFSFQFARVLGVAQEGASTVSECFMTAARIVEGDPESWYCEWSDLARRNVALAEAAESRGHVQTAHNIWLRAANYFRASEFFLDDLARRVAVFDMVESCSRRFMKRMVPEGQVVKVPYEGAAHMDAYFLRAPSGHSPGPLVICFGGLDEYKDELLHEITRHAFARGLSLLLVDLPGQGGTLRRQGLVNRADTEVPVGRCVDYLLSRKDVDPSRIALYGASLGGYYAPRAAAFEHRLACVVADGAQFDLHQGIERLAKHPDRLIWKHIKWVYGKDSIEEVAEKSKAFKLDGVIGKIPCPFLIVHGSLDHFSIQTAHQAFDCAKAAGVDVELKWFQPEDTGASHCQIDNPTIGMEFICDWIADKLGVDQRSLGVST
jgi:dienelactone hydrolase